MCGSTELLRRNGSFFGKTLAKCFPYFGPRQRLGAVLLTGLAALLAAQTVGAGAQKHPPTAVELHPPAVELPSPVVELRRFNATNHPERTCDRNPTRRGTVQALLVGVDEYPGLPIQLKGSANDVDLLREILRARWAPAEAIRSFTGHYATRDNVLQGLQGLVDDSGCHDFVFIHFSGAESRWRPPNGEEDLALFLSDTWIPQDLAPFFPDVGASVLRQPPTPEEGTPRFPGLAGRELRSAMVALRQRGAFAFVSLDTCHAATLVLGEDRRERGIWRWSPQLAQEAEPAGRQELAADAAGYAAFFASAGVTLETHFDDGTPGGRVYGFFSFALALALEDPAVLSIRQTAERIGDFYLQRYKEKKPLGKSARPIFEATDPDFRVLVPLDLQRDFTARGTSESALEIAEPPRTRGLALVRDPALFRVAGRVPRTEGLLAVTANSQPAQLSPDGRFTATLTLQEGESRVYVVAVYRDHSVVQDNFTVAKAGSLAAGRGQSYALVIANQDYRDPAFPHLETPLRDGQGVVELLHTRFGFRTTLPDIRGKEQSLFLQNATRSQIFAALARLGRAVTPDDSVLIFYAGHGVKPEELPEAYWLPVDAERDSPANWMSASDLTAQMRLMKARHVLVVSDSCYSGALTRAAEGGAPPSAQGEEFERYIVQVEQKTSRRLMSSGSNEPVSDGGGDGHSVFARALLRGLAGESRMVFTGEQLFHDHIQEAVAGKSKQLPQYQPIRDSGHEGGDFVFRVVASGS